MTDGSDQKHDPGDHGSPQQTVAAEQPNPSPSQQTADPKKRHTSLEKFASFVAIIAFLAAGYQGWVARDTEKRYLRAYLGEFPPRLQCPDCSNAAYKPETGKIVETKDLIELTVKASGQTPAYNARLDHIDWQPISSGALYDYGVQFVRHPDISNIITSQVTILPGGTIPFQAMIDVADFAAVKFEGKRLRVYGTFIYQDVFKHTWSKDFCYVYQSSMNGPDLFTSCPEHNDDHPTKQNWFESIF